MHTTSSGRLRGAIEFNRPKVLPFCAGSVGKSAIWRSTLSAGSSIRAPSFLKQSTSEISIASGIVQARSSEKHAYRYTKSKQARGRHVARRVANVKDLDSHYPAQAGSAALPFLNPPYFVTLKEGRVPPRPCMSQTSPALRRPSRSRHYHPKGLESSRSLHTSTSPVPPSDTSTLNSLPPYLQDRPRPPIREHLKAWQDQYLKDNPDVFHEVPGFGLVSPQTRLPMTVKGMEELGPNLDAEGDLEDEVFEADTELFGLSQLLQKGDLVQVQTIKGTAETMFAVYLRPSHLDAEFYTIRGSHVCCKYNKVKFKATKYVPLGILDKVLRFLPKQNLPPLEEYNPTMFKGYVIPKNIGGPLIDVMTRFSEQYQDIYRANAVKLDSIHELLADEFEDKELTMDDLTTKVLGKSKDEVSDAELCAIEQSIRRVGAHIYKNGLSATRDMIYKVRSKREMRSIDTVVTWVRQYQESLAKSASPNNSERSTTLKPFRDFIIKARRLIEKSRGVRSPTPSGLGPSKQRYTPDQTENGLVFKQETVASFSVTDRMIIGLVHSWAGSRSVTIQKHMEAAATGILRALGTYDDVSLDVLIGTLCLQEIGVYSPWENHFIFTRGSVLPGYGLSNISDKMLQEVQMFSNSSNSLELVDTMQHLRKDWGDLEVFVVDDESAMDLDDGVSLEPVPDSSGQFWIHIHVANPSAFLRPDHPISKFAARVIGTHYLPERTIEMLPRNLTQGHLSLAPNRPVLTFSAVLNSAGEIVDHKITPGIIRNVTFLSPRTLENLLRTGPATIPIHFGLTVGGKMPQQAKRQLRESFTDAQRQILETLEALRLSHLSWRRTRAVALPAISSRFSNLVDVRVNVGRGPLPPPILSFHQSSLYSGDPIIQLRSSLGGEVYKSIGSENFVQTLMVLGGEIAASWCAARNIPSFYRGALMRHRAGSNQDEAQISNEQAPEDEHASVNRGVVNLRPMPHDILGARGYLKCTSPLRRYGDLVVHWQIEAALRRERCLGMSLVGSQDTTYLPFSQNDLEKNIRWLIPAESMAKTYRITSSRHWATQLMLRAFVFKEARLPDIFHIFITSISRGKGWHHELGEAEFNGTALPWGFVVTVLAPEDPEAGASWALNDLVEARITEVSCYRAKICVQPTRLAQKAKSHTYADQPAAHRQHCSFLSKLYSAEEFQSYKRSDG